MTRRQHVDAIRALLQDMESGASRSYACEPAERKTAMQAASCVADSLFGKGRYRVARDGGTLTIWHLQQQKEPKLLATFRSPVVIEWAAITAAYRVWLGETV